MSKWYLKTPGGGGGSGGGHTILDDDGYILTQRSKMQFNGTYSEDNSTNGVTEVNITRTMTRAEFDLLSDDEKKGLINVIDETSGVAGKFQPVIYSEEEREIGVWTNGKPLYEKTIISEKTFTASTWIEIVDLTSLNIDDLVSTSSTLYYVSSNVYYSVDTSNFSTLYDYSTKKLSGKQTVSGQNNLDGTAHIVIQYTKSTDTAGSGDWTPQGVPAVHYSENEHVVGTWIDGSTIYEKTLKIEPVALSNGSTIAHGVFNLNIVVSSDMVMHRNNGEFVLPYTSQYNKTSNFIITSTDLSFVSSDTWSASDYVNLYVTLRYTKSST